MKRPARKEGARRRFLQARPNIWAARWSLEGGFFDTAHFLCQQTAQKSLKELLYLLGKRGRPFLPHSVQENGPSDKTGDPRISELETGALELALHCDPSQHPSGTPSGSPQIFCGRETAEGVQRDAEQIMRELGSIIANDSTVPLPERGRQEGTICWENSPRAVQLSREGKEKVRLPPGQGCPPPGASSEGRGTRRCDQHESPLACVALPCSRFHSMDREDLSEELGDDLALGSLEDASPIGTPLREVTSKKTKG